MRKFIKRFLRDNEGVTAIEYGPIAGLVALAIVGRVTSLGNDLASVFSSIAASITAETGS